MEINDLQEKLSVPFLPSEIEWRIGATNKDKTSGIALPYITNRAIMNRLDETVGISNWKNEFFIQDKAKICGISIRIGDEWITKYDGADDTNIEATKGGISNAMKRAAVQWGIGRYLYKLPTMWVGIEPNGKSYKIKGKPPELPNWALPKTMQKKTTNNIKDEILFEIPKHIQETISEFSEYGVTQADLENYLNNEAFAFTDDDIETLRKVYWRLKKGANKSDIFPERGKNNKGAELNKRLEEMAK